MSETKTRSVPELVPFVACVMLGGFILYSVIQHDRGGIIPPKEPPPGYKIACDSQGRYAVAMPQGWIWNFADDVSTDRTKVVRKAWYLYNLDQRPTKSRPTINSDWKDCDK